MCLLLPCRTLKGKLARQYPEAFSRKCHPGLLCPISGLCNPRVPPSSAQGWLLGGHLWAWMAMGPKSPGTEGKGGGASLAFKSTCGAGAGTRVPSLGGGGRDKNNSNPCPNECYIPLQIGCYP